MKKLISITMLLLVVIACKKEATPIDKFKEAVDNAKKVKQSEDVQEVLKGSEDVKNNIERLSKLKPTTSSQIKSWLPEDVGNFKRTSFKIERQMGISMVNLTFENDEKKEINITIIDGADVGSAAVSMYLMAQNANIESEDDKGYVRIENFGNHKVMVTYKNSDHDESSEIKTVITNRFLVEAKAYDMKPEKLWGYIKHLEIEHLEN